MDINKKIVIATHELVYGVPQALKDYLLKRKASHLVFLGLPFFVSRNATFTLYKKGKVRESKKLHRPLSFGVFDYFLDFFTVIWWIYKSKNRYEYFIGVNALNCLSGLVLKKMGRVKKVIFYTMDFVPVRFENKLLNYVFHKIEITCVKSSDEVWNVSPRMAEGREKYLDLSRKKYPQRFVPVGIWNKKIKKRPFTKIGKSRIIFIGHLMEKQGVQMVLESFPLIMSEIPKVELLIAGGGDYESELRKKAKKLNLENRVKFTGWITNREELDEMISGSAIAVATYKPEKEMLRNFSYYADPNKLKDYLGGGLPIVLTDISYNAREIEKRKCGVIVKYDKNDISNAVIKLLKNKKALKKYRANTLKYAKELDWINIYNNIFTD